MDCKSHLKSTWPVSSQHSGKHPELMRMIAIHPEFEEKVQRSSTTSSYLNLAKVMTENRCQSQMQFTW
eukprot:9057134-Karenia_brevis.AAC.1